MTTKYYVTMTDQFMSGWGEAENKTNKFVIVCENYEQAKVIYENAKKRPEMKYINIRTTKPRYYPKNNYVVSFRRFDELGEIWTDS